MRKISLAVVVLVVMTVAVTVATNPLRRSDASVEAWLLTKTPMGSNGAEVRAVMDEHGWHDERYRPTSLAHGSQVFLGGEIGSYQGLPWHTSVRAFWEFDSDDRLTGIRIERFMDSP